MSSLYYGPPLLGNEWRAVDPAAMIGTAPSIWKVVGEIVSRGGEILFEFHDKAW